MNEVEAMPYFKVKEKDLELSIVWCERNQLGYSLLTPLFVMVFLTLVCTGGIKAACTQPDFDDYPMLITFCGLWFVFFMPCFSGLFRKHEIRLDQHGLTREIRFVFTWKNVIPLDKVRQFDLNILRRSNRICFSVDAQILYDEESHKMILEYKRKHSIAIENDAYESYSLPLVYSYERMSIDNLNERLNELLRKLNAEIAIADCGSADNLN